MALKKLNPKYQVVLDHEEVGEWNELVERDTAKDAETITTSLGERYHTCPVCGRYVCYVGKGVIPNFCGECGQKLSGKANPEPRDIPLEEI